MIVCWGVDSGLDGQLLCELDDVEVNLCFHDTIKESVLKKQIENSKVCAVILSHFVQRYKDNI